MDVRQQTATATATALIGLAICSILPSARAAAPTLDHLFPVALPAGATQTVAAVGKFDPWPAQLWSDSPRIVFSPETNSGRFQVAIAPDASLGPHWVRAFNEQGASQPRFFVVTAAPQVAEVETNDSFLKPQAIDELPASINGRLERAGDVDCFGVQLEAGQTLVAEVEAYVLGSPLDAALRLVDARGVQFGFNHDDGRTLDPFLAFTAPSRGRYVVQVFGFAYPADSDVRFTGNAKCVYRLHLKAGPYVRHTVPLGVARTGRTRLRLVGWNLGTNDQVEFDGASLLPEATRAVLSHRFFNNVLSLPVSDGVEATEREPNNRLAQAEEHEVPFAVTGRIDAAGDEDRFRVTLKKGDALHLEVQSATLGFPVDPWLKVENAEGKELSKADDNVGSDPVLEWTAPENGSFVIAVGNVLHRGGADQYYRLNVGRSLPEVRVRTAANAWVADPGKTNELKFTVKLLNGAKGKFTAAVGGLPEGVAAENLAVPEQGGEVTIKLAVAADAKPFQGPIRIEIKESASGKVFRAANELVTAGVDNGVPNGFNHLLLESIEQLWLTVPPVKPAKAAEAK